MLGDGTWITAESTNPPRATTWFTRLLRNLAIVDGVMLVLLFFAVRLVTRPLSVLAGAAEELGRNIERPPLPETGTVELVRASRALNIMQDRLKRYVETRLKALGAMSHDLKTPITRMRLRAEMLEDAELKIAFYPRSRRDAADGGLHPGLHAGPERRRRRGECDRPRRPDLEPETGRGGGRPYRHRCRRVAGPGDGASAGAQALPAEPARQCAGLRTARRHHGAPEKAGA